MNMKGSIYQAKEQFTIYRLCGGGGEFWLWHNEIYLITPKALKYSDDPPSWVVNFILSLPYTLSNDRSVPPKNNVIPIKSEPSPPGDKQWLLRNLILYRSAKIKLLMEKRKNMKTKKFAFP